MAAMDLEVGYDGHEVSFSIPGPERPQPVLRVPHAFRSRPRWPQSLFISPFTSLARITNPGDGSRIEEPSGEKPTNPRRVAALRLRSRPRNPRTQRAKRAGNCNAAILFRVFARAVPPSTCDGASSSPTILVPVPVSPRVHVPASAISADLSVASQHCSLPSFKRNQKQAAITAKRSPWRSLAPHTTLRVLRHSRSALHVPASHASVCPREFRDKQTTSTIPGRASSEDWGQSNFQWGGESGPSFGTIFALDNVGGTLFLLSRTTTSPELRASRILSDRIAFDHGKPRALSPRNRHYAASVQPPVSTPTVSDARASKPRIRKPLRCPDKLAMAYRALDTVSQLRKARAAATICPPAAKSQPAQSQHEASVKPATVCPEKATLALRGTVLVEVFRVQAGGCPQLVGSLVGRPALHLTLAAAFVSHSARVRKKAAVFSQDQFGTRAEAQSQGFGSSATCVRTPAVSYMTGDAFVMASQRSRAPRKHAQDMRTDFERTKSRHTSKSTANLSAVATGTASRGHQRLAQGIRCAPYSDNNGFKTRKCAHDRNDFASPEEHRPASRLKYKQTPAQEDNTGVPERLPRRCHQCADPGSAQQEPQRPQSGATASTNRAVRCEYRYSATTTARSVETAPACRDVSNRATLAQVPASRVPFLDTTPKDRAHPPVMRRHAQQRRPGFVKSGLHQEVPGTDPIASAPRPRGSSYIANRRQRALRIDRSTYRSCGSVRGGTHCSPPKGDSHHEAEHKCKTSPAATVPLARGYPQHVYSSPIEYGTRDNVDRARGNVRDTSGSAATCVQQRQRQRHADLRGLRNGSEQSKASIAAFSSSADACATSATLRCQDSTSVTATTVALPRHRQLVQGVGSAPGTDDSIFKTHEYTHNQSDIALPGEHRIAKSL
ncbi:hypothetical protein EDB84DRAFT_1674720 [Lactarius hengduanensis]|nr:hypothetical protein EDB84DRAFT_1674720 [Lactarius hengduanensis]